MNNDLISRSALIYRLEGILRMAENEPIQTYANAIRLAIGETRLAPSVDAEPVRLRIDTAEIDAKKGWYEKLFYCRCGQLIKTEMWDEKYCFGSGTVLKTNVLPKNCPNCGCKIDAEVHDGK